jgi:glutathione S-transferase
MHQWLLLSFFVFSMASSSTTAVGTLHYWSMKARGYPIAVIAKASGVELNWPIESEEVCDRRLEEHQAAGILTFNQWPMLELGGKRIVQSGAIMRLLARRGGLSGDDEDEFVLSETLMCEAEDIFQAMARAHYDQKEGSNQAAWDKFFSEWFRKHCGYLETLLPVDGPFFKSGPKRLAGGLYLACVLDSCLDIEPKSLDDFPKLKRFEEAMIALPEFALRKGRDIYFKRLG